MTRWERRLPLTGVVAVVRWIVAVFVLESTAPGGDASADEILAYFDEDAGSIWIGAFLFALGTAFFLWFVGVLRATFLVAEGAPSLLTAIAFAGAVGTITRALRARY
jgi:hypothetical protein